jgi:hypothetical protein
LPSGGVGGLLLSLLMYHVYGEKLCLKKVNTGRHPDIRFERNRLPMKVSLLAIAYCIRGHTQIQLVIKSLIIMKNATGDNVTKHFWYNLQFRLRHS